MSEKITLSGVPETMLQTVYARAKETKTRGAITDNKAVEIIDRLDYDFSMADKDAAMHSGVIARTIVLDKLVKTYLAGHGGAVAIRVSHFMGQKDYGAIRRQMADSLEDRPFPPLTRKMQEHCFFEFGSGEEHFKYREAVRKAYPDGHFPVFEDHNHMQYQIRDPQGFAAMLERIIEQNELPPLPFLRK